MKKLWILVIYLFIGQATAYATVTAPDILLVFDESSGSTVTNYGTDTTDPTVAQGVENTNWEWVSASSSLDDYLRHITPFGGGSSSMPYTDLTGISFGTTLTHIWAAIGFRVESYDTVSTQHTGHILGVPSSTDFRGGLNIAATDPTSTGDFNLKVTIRDNTFSVHQEAIFEDLAFSTDYRLSTFLDATTASAHKFRVKLDGGTTISPADANRSGGALWLDSAGYLGRFGGFSNYRGFTGRLYYFAYSRGDLITETDLASLNSDPAGTIPGFPGGGGGGGVDPIITIQNLGSGFGPHKSQTLNGVLDQ